MVDGVSLLNGSGQPGPFPLCLDASQQKRRKPPQSTVDVLHCSDISGDPERSAAHSHVDKVQYIRKALPENGSRHAEDDVKSIEMVGGQMVRLHTASLD